MAAHVRCQFKHISSKQIGEQLAENIDTFVKAKTFDRNGIKRCGEGGNDTIPFYLTREEANILRNRLALVLSDDNSSVWFNILSEPLHNLISRSLATTDDNFHQGSTFPVVCRFGSLRSYNQFYSHISFNNREGQISVRFVKQKPNNLCIDFDNIQIIISLHSIQKKNILVNKENAKYGVDILLPLKYAPHFYRLESPKPGDKNQDKKQIRICGDDQHMKFIRDLAHCSDLVLHFEASPNMPWSFLEHLLIDRSERYEINFSTFKICDWSNEHNKNQRPDPFDFKKASFQDRYALQMLISLGFVFRDKWAQLTDQELNWKKWNIDERYSLCCYAVEQLCQDHGYDLTRTERDYNERKKKLITNNNMNEQLVSIDDRKKMKVAVCTLTPLRFIFQPFEITTGSRALRNPKFGGPENFLLVHLREENNEQLRVSNKSIKERLKKSMLDGINLLDKTFIYMGASTGQMKQMAFWFINLPTCFKDIKEAHNVLGNNFNDIKNIATYIARIGQYFSTTWPIGIQLTLVTNKNDIRSNTGQNYVLRIDDIKRNNYCFTDGIGKISWGLAGRIAQKMNISLSSKEDIPSAYQVRVAGCKGMVAIDPESTLNDYYIHIRPSMEKFLSDDWNLEICEFARPLTLTLNDQVIRLLSDLDNPGGAFTSLQNEGFDHWQVLEEEQPSIFDIALQKKISYSTSKDNLFSNRIPIPPKDGRNLFGVADETGELKYGQCFIQYTSLDPKDDVQRKLQIVTGTVLVTKNPCLWPGDFRRLTAVRNSKLEQYMRDVIVFPIDGKRPHSNEISGSDLDGDQYWVYWGNRLKIKENVEPLSYEGATKLEMPLITQKIIVEHIVETFGAGGILGMIANTHTVAADQHEQHSFSDDCKKLAELFAIAVDSPKTGKFIDKEEIRPFQAKYCKKWPNFMKKFDQPTYKSSSILETLFLNAASKYFEIRDTPMINKCLQRMRAIKSPSMIEIEDEEFKKWLDGGIYEAKSTPKKFPKKLSTQLEHNEAPIVPPSTSPKKEKSSSKLPTTTNENSSSATKKSVIKSTEMTSTPPETSITVETTTNSKSKNSLQNPPILINSSASASSISSTTSSLSSLISSNSDPYQPDFLMAVYAKTTTVSNVTFSPIPGSLYTVDLSKGTTDDSDREQIIKKVTSYLEKQNVFKKKSSAYNPTIHGSLDLIIFYGYIYFIEQKTFPQKLGELQDLIKQKQDQLIHFNYTDIDNFSKTKSLFLTTSKGTIDYEFDCYVPSYPLYYITLLFNSSKSLRKVRIYRIWTKCYVRQPNLNADNLYEIRSVLTYDSDSPEFLEIIHSIFKSSQATNLLSGRKPNIEINTNLLQSSVKPISLKIIEQDIRTKINQTEINGFYREVKYVSISEQQEKSKVSPTIEYHTSPITKEERLLEQICDFVISPIEKFSSDRPYSTTSMASSLFNPYH
ncbi:unnamed protein product [Rotaria sordida]|uniref:RNA-dependent RNA polymerase n=2 Tax=Rotaria sordida TaxID=392033 RepID=A0A814VDP2_9BILA|nr:unnamed protein product [Rotaria sordida]CAF1450581.1 unnamed protein product [Rotaria sordida]